MNKFVFPLLLGLLFTACQNTPKNASENTPDATKATETPVAPAPSSEELKQASVAITNSVKTFEDLRKQMDALPVKVRKANAAETESIYGSLEGLIAKQTKMMNDVTSASGTGGNETSDSQGATTLDAAVLKDYLESIPRYAKDAQALQEAISKIAASEKKN